MNAVPALPEPSYAPGISLTEIDGEPRARDLDVARQLGFEQDYDIRKLIKRHRAELKTFGVLATVAKTSGPQGGRPTVEYLLNEEQALLIATVSEAENAPAVRAELIRIFVAWRRGHLVPAFDGAVSELSPGVRSAIGGIVRGVVEGVVTRRLSTLLPEAIEAAILSDPRRAALDLVSVRQLLDEAKVPSKGRNRLNRRVGYELKTRALHMTARGEPSPHRRCAHTSTWLYQRDFAEQLMRDKGRSLVADHLARLTGQTVIPFPNAPARPPDPG